MHQNIKPLCSSLPNWCAHSGLPQKEVTVRRKTMIMAFKPVKEFSDTSGSPSNQMDKKMSPIILKQIYYYTFKLFYWNSPVFQYTGLHKKWPSQLRIRNRIILWSPRPHLFIHMGAPERGFRECVMIQSGILMPAKRNNFGIFNRPCSG